MISLTGITNGFLENASFEVRKGSVCKIIAGSEEEKDGILRTILALDRPVSGKVFISGSDVLAMNERDALAVYKKIGVVWKEGGLISNLKAGENILLPLMYHMGKEAHEVEDRVAGIFGRLGMEADGLPGLMSCLPGTLPAYERMLVGLVRAMLMEPEIMIYDSVFEGLKPGMAGRVARLAGEFHAGAPGRTSVYISPDGQSPYPADADTIIRQEGRGFRYELIG